MPIPPLVAAAGITALGGLAGGLMSDRTARKSASAQRQMDMQFAKNQIQWKVADAKKAGLHPLYALGGSGSYSPTNVIQGQSNTGSALATASGQIADMYLQDQASKSAAQRQAPLLAAQVNAANQSANRDEASAALALSQAKRIEQEIQHVGRPPNLYIPVYNNADNTMEWALNPELGFEMPESISAYKYGKGRLKKETQIMHSGRRGRRGRNKPRRRY
jgi:hypothetical protein